MLTDGEYLHASESEEEEDEEEADVDIVEVKGLNCVS